MGLKLDLGPDVPTWLEDNIIMMAPTGSFSYGTNIETSDRDYGGVCIPPIEYYLGMDSFNQYDSSGGKRYRNTAEDTDVKVDHISKLFKDAMKGSPTSLDLLFIDEDKFTTLNDLGRLLLSNRKMFLSKRVFDRYGGFARAQFRQVVNSTQNRNRLEGSSYERGYDLKKFMHSVRLLTSGTEILNTGDYSTYRPDRNLLIGCRIGMYSLQEAIELVEHYDEELNKALLSTELPTKPNYDQVNDVLVSINARALQLREG